MYDKIRTDTSYFQQRSCYVTQEDNLFGYLTVRETLELSAHFHIRDDSMDDPKSVVDIVDEVIRELNLTKAANTIIGSTSRRGISGGERKRVAIGKQMMSNPLCLFIDEPTSNLDSFQVL